MQKRILIINGNPTKESFSSALAESYKTGAESTGADVLLVNLADLSFDLSLHDGYHKRMELEPDLIKMQAEIKKANLIVFVFPTWWTTYPTLLKGFVDRTFLPGYAFKYHEDSPFWDKYLKGRSARLIVTMDAPKWYYRLVSHSPGINSLKKGILEFCGIGPVRKTILSPIKFSTPEQRERWLKMVEKLGKKQK